MTAPAERISLLSRWLAGTDITLLELTTPEETVRVTRHGPPSPMPAPPTEAGTVVSAPSAGVFLREHPFRAGLLAGAGQSVRQGQAVGLLRIGQLLLLVAAPHDGMVGEMLAADGATVGYGAPLMRMHRT